MLPKEKTNFILCLNIEQCKEEQKKLFSQGFKWFFDEDPDDFRLLSTPKIYPLFIITKNTTFFLEWLPADVVKRKYRDQYIFAQLKHLNDVSENRG